MEPSKLATLRRQLTAASMSDRERLELVAMFAPFALFSCKQVGVGCARPVCQTGSLDHTLNMSHPTTSGTGAAYGCRWVGKCMPHSVPTRHKRSL